MISFNGEEDHSVHNRTLKDIIMNLTPCVTLQIHLGAQIIFPEIITNGKVTNFFKVCCIPNISASA